MKFEFSSLRNKVLGCQGVLTITRQGETITIQYYVQGMYLYVDLNEDSGKRIVLSRAIRDELHREVSYQFDLWVCYDMWSLAEKQRWAQFSEGFSEFFWPLSYRVRNFTWVCFRPFRHWVLPSIRKMLWLVTGPTVHPSDY
jgi:hypothetical protein